METRGDGPTPALPTCWERGAETAMGSMDPLKAVSEWTPASTHWLWLGLRGAGSLAQCGDLCDGPPRRETSEQRTPLPTKRAAGQEKAQCPLHAGRWESSPAPGAGTGLRMCSSDPQATRCRTVASWASVRPRTTSLDLTAQDSQGKRGLLARTEWPPEDGLRPSQAEPQGASTMACL